MVRISRRNHWVTFEIKKKHIFDFCAMVIGYRSVNIIQVALNT